VPVDQQHPATVGLTISLALTGSAHTQASPFPDFEPVISFNIISQQEPGTVENPLKTCLGDKLFTPSGKKTFNGHCLEIMRNHESNFLSFSVDLYPHNPDLSRHSEWKRWTDVSN
jgi:hypothetical protein